MTSGRSQGAGPHRRWARLGLAGLFAASGTLHLVRPDLYLPLMPGALPAHDVLILASGVAELVSAAGLARNTRWAAPASAALLLAIFPANVHFALATSSDPESSSWLVAAAWLRLPLQVPLVWAAFQDRPKASGMAPPWRT
ncbi:MAG: DoxX family protein [Chloroflexi bacterium]|nr:DoxX family protein [Chloroflexota bacterium]